MSRFVLAILVGSVFSCTNEADSQAALEGAGYSNITFHGYSTACGENETCTSFTANGPTGRAVRGAVGCGRGCKGCTIRTF